MLCVATLSDITLTIYGMKRSVQVVFPNTEVMVSASFRTPMWIKFAHYSVVTQLEHRTDEASR